MLVISMDRRGRQQHYSSLCLLFFILSFLLWRRATAETWRLSEEEERELEIELKSINKPYVKSFKDEYGIVFDCVDFYKQPAFDHPLLKNHIPQLKPTAPPKRWRKKTRLGASQAFPQRCPDGTVLIRRTTKEDLIREKKNKKKTQFFLDDQPVQPQESSAGGSNYFAGVNVAAGKDGMIYGAVATLDLYKLPPFSNNQGTATQVALTKGRNGPRNYYNTIQAGWQIDNSYEGDSLTHFFTQWTSDGYQKTGCLDLRCRGFVQTSPILAPGMVLNSTEFKFYILRVKEKSMKWTLYTDDVDIGYWPIEIFNNMADSNEVQIVGSVYSPFDEPSPPMGNGVLRNATVRSILLMNANGDKYTSGLATLRNDLGERYYAVARVGSSTASRLYYGGPGGYKKI